MNKTIPRWQLGGFIFTAVAGTLLHFLFDWTDGNIAAAIISAVNESVWEHLKLLFYPMVIVAICEYFIWDKSLNSFFCIKLVGILTGLIMIPVVYYTYTGILGINADWFNVVIFFLAAGFVFWWETQLFLRGNSRRLCPPAAILILCLFIAVFTYFTFHPPRIPLFQDPLTGSYGFQK